MRNPGIIALCLAFLISCKTSSVTSTSFPYYENISRLRPDLNKKEEKLKDTLIALNTTTNARYTSDIKIELDSVNQIIIEHNKSQRFVDGYTIQIYTGADRQAANDARNRAASLFPELDPQISYAQPTYKVKVGQYVDHLEAYKVFESAKKEFPLALLIPERIIIRHD